jgi:hypothetical protein
VARADGVVVAVGAAVEPGVAVILGVAALGALAVGLGALGARVALAPATSVPGPPPAHSKNFGQTTVTTSSGRVSAITSRSFSEPRIASNLGDAGGVPDRLPAPDAQPAARPARAGPPNTSTRIGACRR